LITSASSFSAADVLPSPCVCADYTSYAAPFAIFADAPDFALRLYARAARDARRAKVRAQRRDTMMRARARDARRAAARASADGAAREFFDVALLLTRGVMLRDARALWRCQR